MRARPDLYATDDAVAALKVVLSTAGGSGRHALLIDLAWHLRQRDSTRALELVREAEDGLAARSDVGAVRLRLRGLLVRAEAATLLLRPGDFAPLVTQARAGFVALGDAIGEGDACLVEAILAVGRGENDRVIACCDAAGVCFARAPDPLRAAYALAWGLFHRASRAPEEVAQTLARTATLPANTALDALFASVDGVLAYHNGDIAGSAACYVRAAELARQAGMIRHAIVSSINAARSMEELADNDGAFAMIEEALGLARTANWPFTLALCEIRLGELLRLLGQFDASQAALRVAIELLGSMPGRAGTGAAYEALGQTLLELGKADEALDALHRAAASFSADGQVDALIATHIGEARALSLAQRPMEALALIELISRQTSTSGMALHAVRLSTARADIYRRHALPDPPGMTEPSAPIHYLEEALAVGRAMPGWHAPAALLSELSDAWGQAGRDDRALQYLRAAVTAKKEQDHGTAAARLITLESRNEARTSRLDAERQRELSTIAAARSITLERDIGDRTEEIGRLRSESTKAAERIRALWRVAVSDTLTDSEYLEAIVTTAAHAVRPGRPFIAYVSELDGTTLTVLATSSPLPSAAIAAGTQAPLQGSFEALVLAQNCTCAVRQADRSFDAGQPLTELGWREAIGAPVRVGTTSYFLVLISVEVLRRESFAEDDIAFLDVVASFFAHRFAQEAQTARLRFQIEHDPLTGLANSAQLRRAVRAAIVDGVPAALCLLDINDFGDVNEAVGFMAGDEVLVEVAAGLAGGDADTIVSRIGGDVFGLLLRNVATGESVSQALEPYRRLFDAPFGAGDRPRNVMVTLSCAIGFAIFPSEGTTVDDVFLHADAALGDAKRAGGASLVMFESQASGALDGRAVRRSDFARAIENDELFLHYQPTFRLESMRVTGAEALIRWHHPIHGDLQPDAFLPSVDRLSLLHALSTWVLSRVARDLSGSAGLPLDFRCYINLAPQQLNDVAFILELREHFGRYPQLAEHIGVEITETAAMRDVERSIYVIELLRSMGVRVAIDDFGTGYSSLNYLRRLPVDLIKIDRSFISGLPVDDKDAAVADTLLRIAQSFGITTLAEGIETAEQLEWLKGHGCAYGQGFLVSKPIPFGELESLLREQSRHDQERALAVAPRRATDVRAAWRFISSDATEALAARGAFIAQLHAGNAGAAVIENAELVFGELVGNVINHAGGPIEIELIWPSDGPVLIVRDRGPSFDPAEMDLPHDDRAEQGRGYFMISSYGSRPLVVRRSTGGSQVTVALGTSER